MASEVSICNMALSHIGESAAVVSISPPDGSTEAGHCARFYSIARAEVLEMHPWAFASKRVTLASLVNDSTAWGYKFQLPSDIIKVVKLLPYGATSDIVGLDYIVAGEGQLYCNDENPTLVYTRLVVDTTRYTPSFTSALSYKLAAYLAGPIVKKATVAQAMLDLASAAVGKAAMLDANASSSETHGQPAPWMTARGAPQAVPDAKVLP